MPPWVPDKIRRASWLALAAGEVIKTLTGKVNPGRDPACHLLLLQAVRDFHRITGLARGVKAAGGIRTTKGAIRLLVLVNETSGRTG